MREMYSIPKFVVICSIRPSNINEGALVDDKHYEVCLNE
jgi:hypothetical protein